MKNLFVTLVLILISINLIHAQSTPTIVLKTSLPVGSEVSLLVGTSNDTTIRIDWGNGILVPYNTVWDPALFNNTLSGKSIKIYGSTIHNFIARTVMIDTADFSNCPGLTDLQISDCGLLSIDISKNNKLINCYITGNKLKALDCTNDTSLYVLSCDKNQLANLDISNSKKLHHLSISRNKFSSIDVTHNTLLTYFDCNSNEFSNIDITKNTSLDFFNCGKNNISTLDVSKNTELNYLHCYSNPLLDLDVSKNVKVINSDLSATQLTHIDLSNNTELIQLYCTYNTLSNLDLSKNGKLERLYCYDGTLEKLNLGNISLLKELYCYNNKLSSLDVSNDAALRDFRCNNNQITTIDISKNNALIWLYCFSNKISSLSLPANSTFFVLDCRYNLLTNIDVSKSIGLAYFRCIENKLKSLDLSANAALVQVKCDSNYLTIASLPLKEVSWTTYLYAPQNRIMLSKLQFDTYEAIDLKNQVSRAGTSSVFTWKTKGGNTLIEGTDYTESSGIFAFLKYQTDSVYCEIINEVFPDLILETSRFVVQLPTSINEYELKTSVFPNPFTDILQIESVQPIKYIEIFSIAGEKLFELEVNGERSVLIPAKNLPNGILVINIKGDKYSYTTKIVKK